MKKSRPRQLVLNRETLRALSNVDLALAGGGAQSGEAVCSAVVPVPTLIPGVSGCIAG